MSSGLVIVTNTYVNREIINPITAGTIVAGNSRSSYSVKTGSGDQSGNYTATVSGVTEYFDGLTIRVRIDTDTNNVANSLNVNNLGARIICYKKDTVLTTQYSKYSELTLTYRTDAHSGFTPPSSFGAFVANTTYTAGWVVEASTESSGGGSDTSNCVHLSGNETVGGLKTFSDGIIITNSDNIRYASGAAYSSLTQQLSTISAGTLNTTASTSLSVASSESLHGTINLHKVSKTGSYNDLNNKPTIPTVGTLTTTASTVLSTASSESLGGSISLHKVSKTGDYNDLTNTPTIPSAPGTLNTNVTSAQSVKSSEALSGTIKLHKVAKTGTYSDLIGTPTIPTVNNATLTIQKNGTNVATFGANASSNVTANITVNELPTVTSSDNGKILLVQNGAWVLSSPINIWTGSDTPNNSLGNDGDLYFQV